MLSCVVCVGIVGAHHLTGAVPPTPWGAEGRDRKHPAAATGGGGMAGPAAPAHEILLGGAKLSR